MANASAQIIEMVGVHGSGKSTIAAHLAGWDIDVAEPSDLFQTGRVNDRMPLTRGLGIVGDACLIGARHPLVGISLMRYWFQSGPNAKRLRMLLTLTSWMRRIDMIKARTAGSIVLTEGFIHQLARASLPGPCQPNPVPLVRAALPGRVAALIHVRCDPDVAYARTRKRPPTRSRIQLWPDEIARPSHRVVAALSSQAVKAARDCGVLVFEVDSLQVPASENARLIAQWLEARQLVSPSGKFPRTTLSTKDAIEG